MEIQDKMIEGSLSHLVTVAIGALLAGIWWVVRVTFTNREQIEIFREEMQGVRKDFREELKGMREADRALHERIDRIFEVRP